MPLTFVAGSAHDILSPDLARVVEATLREQFALAGGPAGSAYTSDEVEPRGWSALQKRIPQLTGIDAYQAVFVDVPLSVVQNLQVPNLADPFHVASLPELVRNLGSFAAAESLPTDDLGLMQLAAKYLEDDALIDADLDVQTYVQLMLTARQAVARKQALWIV